MPAKWLELLCTVIPTAKRIACCATRPIANQNGIVFTALQPLPGTNP